MGITSKTAIPIISATAFTAAMLTTPIAILGAATAAHAETAVPAEKNPPGDIPDSQVFLDYTSPLGFKIKVPEGWARSDAPDGARFVDKLDGVILTTADVTQKPDVQTAKDTYVKDLKSSARAVEVRAVKAVKLPSGEAIRIVYTSNSEPNAVTNKQVRLENERYLFYKNGKLVTLELYAPKGADNVDQWRLMSRSFAWK